MNFIAKITSKNQIQSLRNNHFQKGSHFGVSSDYHLHLTVPRVYRMRSQVVTSRSKKIIINTLTLFTLYTLNNIK